MKNLLIICSVIFLLVGDVLLSNTHYLHDHDDHHETHLSHECEECIIIKSFNNYVSDSQEVFFSNNNINQLIVQYLSLIEYSIDDIINPRAPPIS
jgi:hypothetical protein|tara:strand:- start:514 stop:798 length:285 start_codon:yes stop_codon:yes gene_type:complete